MKKIGKGYWQSGYGRGFKKNVIVRLINGKAYVKDSSSLPFETDIEGMTMVNAFNGGDNKEQFAAVGLISEHLRYEKIN